MGIVLIAMALIASILAAQIAAFAIFREFEPVLQVSTPVCMTLAALAIGIVLGDTTEGKMDLQANGQRLQAIVAVVGTALLAGLCFFFLKPTKRRVTFMRALTIGLASMAALLGSIRLWAAMIG